jgi:16S rRNA (adenine1518-N6/adenine1519-N6)-dimethyltransferase
MTLTEMRQILTERDLQLTKSLGQNFLHDGNQLRRIVAAAELSAADKVLEIGPGLGPLTSALVAQASEVLAIEKDRRLVTFLEQRFAGVPGFRLIHADALEYLREPEQDWAGWKLVANLPYSVASPILVELALNRHPPERLVATLQLEVVQRVVAPAGGADYGILSLLLQAIYRPAGSFKIPASCFFPAPDIDSGCVVLLRRNPALLGHEERGTFVRVVKQSFGQRRKMMFKLLKTTWPEARLDVAFAHAGIPLAARAETVTLEQFVALATALHEPGTRDE